MSDVPSSSSTNQWSGDKQRESLLGSDLKITGSITSTGAIRVEGEVNGDVRAGMLTVGEKAAIDGDAAADVAIVQGRIAGSLRAREVQLKSTARMEGELLHASLTVEAGAYLDGTCRRVADPGASKPKEPAAQKPATDATPEQPKKPAQPTLVDVTPAAAAASGAKK